VLAALTDKGTIDVYSVDSGRRVNSWSAPANATSIDVQYGIALVTAGRDVYATKLSTGRTARVFRAPTTVRAQIEAPGAAIVFNVAGHGHIQFLPMNRIEASLIPTGR
jgi:hypothetical protein